MLEPVYPILRPQMFALLSRAMADLPKLLDDEEGWYSMDIDYHPPRVERVFRFIEDNGARLFLHRIEPCDKDAALFHPHPWPSALQVLDGTYWMKVGSSPDLTPPANVLSMQVTATPECCFRYEMTHPDGWHAVVPIGGPVYSVMVTGTPWKRPIPEVTKRASLGLLPLPPFRKQQLLEEFRQRIRL